MASQVDTVPLANDAPQQDDETPTEEVPVPMVTSSQTKESAECEETAVEDSATSSQTEKEKESKGLFHKTIYFKFPTLCAAKNCINQEVVIQ